MNPPSFLGSKTDEDPREFIDQIHKVTDIIGVTTVESAELVTYKLQDVAHTWYKQWTSKRVNDTGPIEWKEFFKAFLDRFFSQELRGAKVYDSCPSGLQIWRTLFDARAKIISGADLSKFRTALEKLDWRLSHEVPTEDCSEEESDAAYREYVMCKVFLGFTSNLVSSGVRDTICYLVQHRMASDIQGTLPVVSVLLTFVDVVVTIAGGIEEDLIKCLAPTYKGDFSLPGASLRSKGLNCIGNLLVPNDNYCKFENWIIPIFDQMYEEHIKEVFTVVRSRFDLCDLFDIG
ncbi:Deoxyhypusine synthase [Capsicum annuum]|nr:Deoxyhypusine synthase [Capsicum annuum]